MIVLLADAHTRTNAITIASSSDQLKDDPVVVVRTDVLPQFGGVLERRDSDLTGATAPLTNTILIQPGGADSVAITRSSQIALDNGFLVLTVMASDVLQGGDATVQFSLLNPGGAEIEVITAQNGGASPSGDIRFNLLDSDGNVLSTVPLQQTIGSNIINLANGNSVMLLEPGAQGLSSVVMLPVPESAPGQVFVQVQIDHVYYDIDGQDAVVMGGLQSQAQFPGRRNQRSTTVTNISPWSIPGKPAHRHFRRRPMAQQALASAERAFVGEDSQRRLCAH